jgi:hypothetical protein
LSAQRVLPAEPGANDDRELAELLERPMEGAIRLVLSRSPSPRAAAAVDGERFRIVTARDRSGALLGMGVRSVRPVYWQGEPARVGYLGQLRTAGVVGRGPLRAGFGELLADRREDELGFDLTTIASDNQRARRLLERGLPGLPRYQRVGEVVTLVFSTDPAGGGKGGPVVRPATAADREAILARLDGDRGRYQLAPRWSAADLEPGGRNRGLEIGHFLVVDGGRSDGAVRGCVAVWDQRAYKQVVVAGYAPWLGLARHLLAPWWRWRGTPRLPAPGSTLALASLAAICAEDGAVAIALVRAAARAARDRGLEQLVLCLPAGHPHVPVLGRLGRPRRYGTVLYAVGGQETDVAQLRAGLVHLEGANL